ncbi:amino acid transporter [Trichodelitschia bisporula]|uniref:Amino acid transporter n=1 Tax=Trichodelitschia bisporula TaxID=703511 RepID=A0A6G1I1S9_9PEZI|nr:amino acid transporter [Trichodelitschia bisporula]
MSTPGDDVKAYSERFGTAADRMDMYRMGKTQKLRRNFGFLSIFGFSMILLSTWETQLGSAVNGINNGGTAGMIYVYIGTFIGFSAVIASMAEMASMAPTAGGQYHWVSEFSPKEYQKFLSYMVGWLSALGWQTGAASSAFLAGTEIQALIVLNYPTTYHMKPWHGSLMVICLTIICGIFNTFLARKLPLVEGTVLILHVIGFFAVMIPLWILAPRTPAEEVFTSFMDNGWGNQGLSCLVGILTPTVALIGSDAATHMSEELQDASYTLPRAMMATAVFNGILGFLMLITFCFCLGDVDAVRASPAGALYPFVQVFADGTQSIGGATVMTSVLITLSVFCCITNIATASRQLFAFARDNGIPFAKVFAYVPPGWDIPLNAVILTLVFVSALSLINIGSTIAYNTITSLGVCALVSSYMVSISCVTLKRWRGEPLLKRRFSLGQYGMAINAFSVLFLLLVFVMCFFPPEPNPPPSVMNWSIIMYGAVMLFSLIYYYFKGRHVYVGPVKYVRKDQ